MAKKTKRQTSRSDSSAAPLVDSTSRVSTPASSARPIEKEFNPDYSYVVKDLKRIGTLAGIFFSVLLILSIFLR